MFIEEKEQLLPIQSYRLTNCDWLHVESQIFPSNAQIQLVKALKLFFFFPLNNDSCLILKLFSFEFSDQEKKNCTVSSLLQLLANEVQISKN